MSLNLKLSLPQLGWRPFFQQQLTLEELDTLTIGRIIAHHRSLYLVQTENEGVPVSIRPKMPPLTVGDWILVDAEQQFVRELERLTVLSRKAAGPKVDEQLIAANVDTLFIVSSMNHDFNLNRIERYLAIANESCCEPVVVLTKADCCEEPEWFSEQIRSLNPMLPVESVNALDVKTVEQLSPWCETGKSIVFVGSSGVGKSTLVNTLMNDELQETSGIREDDSKGRHTTTSRSVHPMPSGALLIDTPGVRELQIAACEQGVEETFQDIIALAEQCKFSNCQHNTEPKCAVTDAVSEGRLDQRRVDNFLKLMLEQQRNAESIAEMRSKSKSLSKLIRTHQNATRIEKGK